MGTKSEVINKEMHNLKIVDAGYDYVESVRHTADISTPFPMWYEWAIREAFIAGVKWRNGNHE